MSFTRELAFDYLRRAHAAQRLAHAYLIAGEAGSGKRALALELAALVNGISPERAATHPDVHWCEPESKSRRIVIEQIRAVEHALQLRASTGRRKVVIVSDADRLQPQAANAFLKTLEEPPNDSLLLLLSALPEVLPDTIVSRCINVELAPAAGRVSLPEEETLLMLLRASSRAAAGDVRPAFRLASGFARLLAQIRQTIQEENAEALKREETRYKNTTDGAWLDSREDHYKALSESVYLERRARLLELLFDWWADVLRARTGAAKPSLAVVAAETASLASRLSAPEILRKLRRLEELRDQLGRNIQEALALEAAFLRVFRL